jgi:ABC-2 type transport system permease protein
MSATLTTPPTLTTPAPARAALRRVWGLLYRHLALYRRSWPRCLELIYWPIFQMLVWGFTARFLGARLGQPAFVIGGGVLGGVLLWEVAMRSQLGVAAGFLEEIWSRNLGHVFVSPLRPHELVAGLIALSVLRLVFGLAPALLLAWLLYAFNIFSLGPALLPFVANLMIMGWWMSLGIISLILRHGAGAEALAWSLMFGLAPFCAIYYPVAVLPWWMQPLARALPAAHVFEGMRSVLGGHGLAWSELAWASLLNLCWVSAAVLLFARQFRAARERGALIAIGE